VEVFEEAQRRGIWTETDTVSANMALDGLSGSAQAAFAKCAPSLASMPLQLQCGAVPLEPALEASSRTMKSCLIALSRFEELVAAGLAPTLVTFNTLLKACMRCHDLPRAQLVMGWISAAGLQVQACLSYSLF
jgi:hypothetical protein